ncbi:MAG: hypothetical protein DYG89_33850 [Caldilinea sp. CFX5]|nr:hypothetical protein [Caldilinea sp. CFX5]
MSIEYNEYIKTEAWRQRAEAAKARAGQRCQICNRAAPRVTLTVHHRTFERLGQEQPEDLTVLCRSCYELYDKNRRMPNPPTPQPAAPAAKADKASKPHRPPLTPASPPRLFAPARASKRRTTPDEQNGHNGQNGHTDTLLLPLPTDTIYRLATDAQATADASFFALSPTPEDDAAVHVYQLAVETESKAAAQSASPPTQSHRWQWVLVTVVGLAVLLILGLSDLAPDWSALVAQRAALNPVAATPVDSVPAVVATVAAPVDTPTAAPTAAPTLTPVLPTMTPTPLPPTPTTVPPTVAPAPTAPPPTLVPAPLSSVIRTALVCQNPCSCAPIVRTIPQGTEVTVLQTQVCGGDVWYQIGENEWLGPGLVDPK